MFSAEYGARVGHNPFMNEWPTLVTTGVPPFSLMTSGTALEQMRLCRTSSPGYFSSIALATMAVVVDPLTGSALSSTKKHRSASPSKAKPTSAPVSRTRALSRPDWQVGWGRRDGWGNCRPVRRT